MTLAGFYLLYVAATLVPSIEQLGIAAEILILSCAGTALIHSRRSLSTWMFGENPSHDSVALANAGDVRLLVVRLVALVLFLHLLVPSPLSPLSVVLALIVGVCWFRPRLATSLLFAAGAGDGSSDTSRDQAPFWFALVGISFAIAALPRLVADLTEPLRNMPAIAGELLVVIAGLTLFAANRWRAGL